MSTPTTTTTLSTDAPSSSLAPFSSSLTIRSRVISDSNVISAVEEFTAVPLLPITPSSDGLFGTTTGTSARRHPPERPDRAPGNYSNIEGSSLRADSESLRKLVLVDLIWMNMEEFPILPGPKGTRGRIEWSMLALEKIICIITATSSTIITHPQFTSFLQTAALLRREISSIREIVDEHHHAASSDRVRLDFDVKILYSNEEKEEEELLCSVSVADAKVAPAGGHDMIKKLDALLHKLSRYFKSLLTWTPKQHLIHGEELNLRRFLKNLEYLRIRLQDDTFRYETFLQASYIDTVGSMFVATQAAQHALDMLQISFDECTSEKTSPDARKYSLGAVQMNVNEAQQNVDNVQRGLKRQQQMMIRLWSEQRKDWCA